MVRPLPTKILIPVAAAGALALAGYAWVGPMWFAQVPERRGPTIGLIGGGEETGGPGPVVGRERRTSYSMLAEPLTALRGPEAEDEPIEETIDEPEPAVEEPPAERMPFEGWRYTGYIGSGDALIAILELPSGDQVFAVAGDVIAERPSPTVIRVDRDEVELMTGDEGATIRRDVDGEAERVAEGAVGGRSAGGDHADRRGRGDSQNRRRDDGRGGSR
jgi:hypothetical protein